MAVNKPLPEGAPDFIGTPDTTGEQLAVRVRERLELGDGDGVSSVITIMEELFGLRVIELPTENRIDGFAAKYGAEHVVVLNPDVPNDRNRLNAGHELGHVLFSDCEEHATLTHKEVESRAYEFGFHLLMPRNDLREAFQGKSMVKLVKYKEKFGVSLAAMIYRAEQNGIIQAKETEWLWRQFAIRGWRKNEPGKVRPDRATRFEMLFEEATTKQPSRRHTLLKAMGVSDAEMKARLNLAAGMGQPSESDDDQEEERGGDDPDVVQFPR